MTDAPADPPAPLGYCRGCGRPLTERHIHGRARPFCIDCQRPVFDDPKLAVAVIVAIDGRILLQQRAIDPGRGAWTFPSGFVDRGEVVEEAAARETLEEVRLPVRVDRLLGLYSRAGNPVVLAVYTATPLADTFAAGDEVAAVALFDPVDLPRLAFPQDERIIADYLATLARSRAGASGTSLALDRPDV
ncbi:MAG: NUDIX domain-containing protein [Chloroflexi bacterium]|nr:NUDIX domain-containing protein [Chloroflexota bacterium]